MPFRMPPAGRVAMVALSCVVALSTSGAAQAASAAFDPPPSYSISDVLLPPYEMNVPFAAQAPEGLSVTPTQAPVYKPHEVAIDSSLGIWISSNERGEHGNQDAYNPDGTRVGEFRGGISIFKTGTNQLLSTLIIDEPQFAPDATGYPKNGIIGPVSEPYTSSTGWLYHGMDLLGTKGAKTSSEAGEETGNEVCPKRPGPAPSFVQTVFLPVVLPPGSQWDPENWPKLDPLGRTDPSGQVLHVAGKDHYGNPILVGYDAYGRPSIMAPMGAECHPRHPHGIAIDQQDGLVYLLIEHLGLQWNSTRTDFVISDSTDAEAGGVLVFSIAGPGSVTHPQIVTGYLSGHGAHEVEVSQQNGYVFMPNHEESPGVQPDIFQVVVNPFVGLEDSHYQLAKPAKEEEEGEEGVYGFIDTGYYQALQDLSINDGPGGDNTVYMVSHVGQRLYAIDGNCTPAPNPTITYATDPNAPNKTYIEEESGANCIKYWVDLRAPFDQFYGSVSTQIFANLDANLPSGCLPAVLHFHNLAFDPVNMKVYAGVHAIHFAEHTGLPWEGSSCAEDEENEVTGEEPDQVTGRSVVVADVNPADITSINPVTKQATTSTSVIDLSQPGYGYLAYPNVDDLVNSPNPPLNGAQAAERINLLESAFVHPHWLAVDPSRNVLLVSGEHTGNVAVVSLSKNKMTNIIPVSILNTGLANDPSSDCVVSATGVPEDLEPHLHGLQIDPSTGTVYLSDEGEHCFYEAEIIMTPSTNVH